MKMQLDEIAQALGIEDFPKSWEEVTVTSVSFDSRQLQPGALFVPLKGANDGHQFIQKAIDAHAAATLWQTDHPEVPTAIPALMVKDSLVAMQKLAKYYLHKINPQVVAITGSNGKTTTKDMVASVLGTQYNVTKTFANFNNEIGVPMTCLSMEPNTEVLVVEMGMDRFGQLDKLSRLVEPDIAVITMIGEAHIEFFGTRERIADAKMEITHGLKEDGTLVFNGDEPLLRQRTIGLTQNTRTFGFQQRNDLVAKDVHGDKDETLFKVSSLTDQAFSIPMLGDYNVKNALAAIEVGILMHIGLPNIVKALKNFELTANRTEWITGQAGERILSDVYNSNPTAVKAVLHSFDQIELEQGGRRIVVLGDMLELGNKSSKLHASLATVIDPQKIDEVYLYGKEIYSLKEKLDHKMDPQRIHYFALGDQGSMIKQLQTVLKENDIILLKGSHGMHLENVLDALKIPAE